MTSEPLEWTKAGLAEAGFSGFVRFADSDSEVIPGIQASTSRADGYGISDVPGRESRHF